MTHFLKIDQKDPSKDSMGQFEKNGPFWLKHIKLGWFSKAMKLPFFMW